MTYNDFINTILQLFENFMPFLLGLGIISIVGAVICVCLIVHAIKYAVRRLTDKNK